MCVRVTFVNRIVRNAGCHITANATGLSFCSFFSGVTRAYVGIPKSQRLLFVKQAVYGPVSCCLTNCIETLNCKLRCYLAHAMKCIWNVPH